MNPAKLPVKLPGPRVEAAERGKAPKPALVTTPDHGQFAVTPSPSEWTFPWTRASFPHPKILTALRVTPLTSYCRTASAVLWSPAHFAAARALRSWTVIFQGCRRRAHVWLSQRTLQPKSAPGTTWPPNRRELSGCTRPANYRTENEPVMG